MGEPHQLIEEPRPVYAFIAGDRALDLVNTVSWRISRTRFAEHLLTYADVIRWFFQAELISDSERESLTRLAAAAPDAAAVERHAVLGLREAVYDTAFEDGSADPIARQYATAIREGELERDGGTWSWSFPLDLALPRRRIALAAMDLLTGTTTPRLRQCADAECGWVFLDTSPRRNRRWCVAEDCGNRNRVREHYARSRAPQSG